MMLAIVVGLPFLAAALIGCLPAGDRRWAARLAMTMTLLAGACLATTTGPVFSGEVVGASVPWLPLPGADFGFRADGLGWMFAALVLGIGALVILYAHYYLATDDPKPRFFACFMFFMGAMLGIVLADNLLLLAGFWELTSIASFLLIGYWQRRADARQGARMALVVTGLGGLALLAGVILLGQMAGSLKLDVILASGEVLRAHPWYLPALLLVLLAAFTKSAQVPFHFWLPHAMAAPTPVSAYLHSATMVKAGVFLLARLYPALAGTDAWFYLVSGTGALTLLIGAYIAIFQHDLKGLLAYSTISHLGLITLLFGMGRPLAVVAGVFHILNHATFKASLFMAAGIIDHETGTRDMRRLAGLRRYMPLTAVLAITSALAMAGVPLLNGFLSKEMFFAETLDLGRGQLVLVGAAVIATVAGAFAVAYSTRFVHDVFWGGEPRDLPRSPHEPPAWMVVPVAVLTVLCLLVGVLPNVIIGPLLGVSAAATLAATPPAYTLAIWHGFNLPLLMSFIALGLGVVLYFSLRRLFRLHDLVHLPRGGREVFAAVTGGLVAFARRLAGSFEAVGVGGSLRWLVATALVLGLWPFLGLGYQPGPLPPGQPGWPALALATLAVIATLGVVAGYRHRFLAVVLIGAVGLLVSLAFAALSAPDLALTQLLVEVASVMLLLLALFYLPRESPRRTRRTGPALGDGVLAVGAGVGVAALVYAVLTRPFDSISAWHLANAVPGAAGSNAVNVIIVDFRGFDTLGEITVLGVAGLIVADLLRGYSPARWFRPVDRPASDTRSFMLDSAATLLLPLAVTVAGFMFLRGHNLPGGGFIGGLILAVGLLLPYLARGTGWVEERVLINYQTPLALGLLIAGLTGLGSFAFGHPFLTSSYLAPVVPVLGKLSLASALFFDLGVFLTVAGATMLALTRLGRIGVRTAGVR